MKTANQLLEELSGKMGLREGDTIVLTEHEPENSNDPNWVVDVHIYNAKALADMRKNNLRVDWSAVEERDGDNRRNIQVVVARKAHPTKSSRHP